MVLARRYSKVACTLYPQLVPNSTQIAALVELHLVGNKSSTKLFVGCVLQVPARLTLLYVLADDGAVAVLRIVDRPPDFEILDGVTILVF